MMQHRLCLVDQRGPPNVLQLSSPAVLRLQAAELAHMRAGVHSVLGDKGRTNDTIVPFGPLSSAPPLALTASKLTIALR